MWTKMVTRLFLSLPFAKYGGAQVEQLHWMWIKVFIIKFHQMAAVEWNTITSIKHCSSSPPTFVLPDKFFCFQIPAEFCCISSLYILPFYSFLWIICLMFCNKMVSQEKNITLSLLKQLWYSCIFVATPDTNRMMPCVLVWIWKFLKCIKTWEKCVYLFIEKPPFQIFGW